MGHCGGGIVLSTCTTPCMNCELYWHDRIGVGGAGGGVQLGKQSHS